MIYMSNPVKRKQEYDLVKITIVRLDLKKKYFGVEKKSHINLISIQKRHRSHRYV